MKQNNGKYQTSYYNVVNLYPSLHADEIILVIIAHLTMALVTFKAAKTFLVNKLIKSTSCFLFSNQIRS